MSLLCQPLAFENLNKCLSERHRHYHNSGHVADCLAQFDFASEQLVIENADEIEFSIWLHDAIYSPRKSNNEAKSANLAQQILRDGGAGQATIGNIQRLIMATKHEAVPLAFDEQLIVDIDLSILGRDATAYDAYESAIRREYAWVPHPMYAKKRTLVLEAFLERDRIYSTDIFFDQFEAAARDNLRRAIAAL
ncbi:MAG: N-methyl-D-aspartate receptor NMDAR2C subunit [Planctomycetaceae bacterium]|nr:N-methyl-D-aspartate receptor NMDAR2C subunit [Planctomycetaceae bacterium]